MAPELLIRNGEFLQSKILGKLSVQGCTLNDIIGDDMLFVRVGRWKKSEVSYKSLQVRV